MNKYKEINIDDIVIQNERLWKIKDEQVQNLKKSIEEIGLMNPVTIQKRQDRYILIGGEHRYTACKQLDHKTILCNIIPREYEDDEVENARLILMEVDENLVRRTADFIEESFLLNKRKIAYEKLHPNCTAQKVRNFKNSNEYKNATIPITPAQDNEMKTFIQDTSKKTGLTDGNIASKLRVGETIPEAKKDLIKDSKVNAHTLMSIS